MNRILAALGLLVVLAAAGQAQTVSNSFTGLSGNAKEPIDIESDVLVVHDKDKHAVFSGNVKAIQGTTTLRARQLDVHYVGNDTLGGPAPAAKSAPAPAAKEVAEDAKPADKTAEAKPKTSAGSDDDTKITKIEAKGDVTITSDDQTTKSEWALYDVPAQLVTVGGNVVLTQGDNVLKGERLVINLATGESRFENPGNTASGGGRIRALFMPKGAPAKDAKSNGNATGGKERDQTRAAKPSAESDDGKAEGGVAVDDRPLAIDPLRGGAQ